MARTFPTNSIRISVFRDITKIRKKSPISKKSRIFIWNYNTEIY